MMIFGIIYLVCIVLTAMWIIYRLRQDKKNGLNNHGWVVFLLLGSILWPCLIIISLSEIAEWVEKHASKLLYYGIDKEGK